MNALNEDMKVVDAQLTNGRPPSRQQVFDAESAIKNLESEGVQRWELQPRPLPPEKYRKLKEALESLSTLPQPTSRNESTDEAREANEWSTYAQREEERRALAESTYKRFRIATKVPEPVPPQADLFEYEEVEFPLPSGEVVKQPVAHIKQPFSLTPPYALTDVYWSGVDQLTVGTNTDINERSAILSARNRIKEGDGGRESFVAQLVAKSKPKPLAIREGQRVSVSYFGIMCPGTVVKRDHGAGTVTVRFEDCTSNDFPIHAIVL